MLNARKRKYLEFISHEETRALSCAEGDVNQLRAPTVTAREKRAIIS